MTFDTLGVEHGKNRETLSDQGSINRQTDQHTGGDERPRPARSDRSQDLIVACEPRGPGAERLAAGEPLGAVAYIRRTSIARASA
jgi:hypothetical protein